MLYTTEEAAVICGFLNAHLAQAGVEVSVRKRNAAFQRGVIMGTLQPDDYRWAENVLCFLKPCWWQLHEDHRALENVLLKTYVHFLQRLVLLWNPSSQMQNKQRQKRHNNSDI